MSKIMNAFLHCGVFMYLTQGLLCQVLELDESFLEKKSNRAWLVEFYAPWCGHCRKLEPIYHQVFLELRASTEILVAKVDATRFGGIAQQYDVRGYPTIKFIEGENVFSYSGERSKEGLVEFAKRAKAPHVRNIKNIGKFTDIKSSHSGGVFFVYVGEDNPENELQKQFVDLASKYAVYSYFYQAEKKVLPTSIQTSKDPTVLCFKDETVYEYHSTEDASHTLQEWFNMERYPAFVRVNGAGINEMSDINKKLVVIVTDEKDKGNTRQNRFKDLGRMIATKRREQYHKDYQFIWMSEPETMEQITMTDREIPYVLILDTSSHYYYLPDIDMKDLTMESFAQFIQNVTEEKSAPLGGSGILQRFQRLGYDIKSLVYSIYRESPWLALMVFGIPSAVISIVCYALCCMEPFDEESLDDVSEERKKEILAERAARDAETDDDDDGEDDDVDLLDQDNVEEKDDGHLKKD